jgi:hypothetical protein
MILLRGKPNPKYIWEITHNHEKNFKMGGMEF